MSYSSDIHHLFVHILHLFHASKQSAAHMPKAEAKDNVKKILLKDVDISITALHKIEHDPFTRIILEGKYNKKQTVIIKAIFAPRYSLTTTRLKNQIIMQTILTKNSQTDRISLPKIEYVNHTKNGIVVVENKAHGIPLADSNKNFTDIFDECACYLRRQTKLLASSQKIKFAHRTVWSFYLSYPFLYLIALVKNPSLWKTFIKLNHVFASNISIQDLIHPKYEIAHRDLTPENILVSKKSKTIIDTEVMALAEKGTDLSLYPRFYYRYVPWKTITEYLKSELYDRQTTSRFFRQTIYYTVHYLAICAKNDKYYTEAHNYATAILTKVIPAVSWPRRTIFEFSLSTALRFGNILPKTSFTRISKPFILCYHSISNHRDRYAVSKQVFAFQIEFLKQHTSVVSTKQIRIYAHKNNRPSSAITFDDGYLDAYTNAFPILKAYRFPATVFIIAEFINKAVIKTYRKIQTLSNKHIQKLIKAGWIIGSHTCSHRNMRLLSLNESYKEIYNSKKYIEQELHTQVHEFAYPYGAYLRTHFNQLASCGYTCAYTTDGGFFTKPNNYKIPRLTVEGALSINEFKMLCTPYGHFTSGFLMNLLSIKIKLEELFRGK